MNIVKRLKLLLTLLLLHTLTIQRKTHNNQEQTFEQFSLLSINTNNNALNFLISNI